MKNLISRTLLTIAMAAGACSCSKESESSPKGGGLKAELAECSSPHFAFVARGSGWSQASPVFWFIEGSASDLGEDDVEFEFKGDSTPEAIPVSAAAAGPGAYLPIPGKTQGLIVPLNVLNLGEAYKLTARVSNDTYFPWKVVEVRDTSGALRILHLTGETQLAPAALEAIGWQVSFTPACWTVNCYDPLVHHDLTLSDQANVWSAPDRSDEVVVVGGLSFRVINDAAAVPGVRANSTCADVGNSYWNVTLLAHD